MMSCQRGTVKTGANSTATKRALPTSNGLTMPSFISVRAKTVKALMTSSIQKSRVFHRRYFLSPMMTLGLGVPEPYPSWGRMLSVSATEFAQRAPWLVIFPGLAISLVVFASNLFGDGLRDYLDPRLRL